jgi:hypothetical protein
VTAWFQKHRKLKRYLVPVLDPSILDASWEDWDARWVMTDEDTHDEATNDGTNQEDQSLDSPRHKPELPTAPSD